MIRNRLGIISWAATVAAAASLGGYAWTTDRHNKSILHYMEAGEMAEHCGNMRTAAKNYRKALDVDERYLPARIAVADMRYQEGDHKGALAVLRGGIAVDPRNPDAHAALARALMEYRRYPEAIKRLERAVALAPRDGYLRMLLASCHRRRGDIAQANRQLAEIAKVAPDSPAAIAARRTLGRDHNKTAPSASRSQARDGCCDAGGTGGCSPGGM